MATNILAMPLAHLTMQTGNNEDWIDALMYVSNVTGLPQFDLRGIDFEMELRRHPAEHEVIIHASTVDGSLSIGAAPNYGYLIFYLPLSYMRERIAGSYVGDVRASDDQFDRVVLTIDLTVLEGVTK
jgi:hypothetical protein